MTDNEIIKALKIVSTTANCDECAFCRGKVCNCSQVTAKNALDLINRQKAEIERLEAELERQYELDLVKELTEQRKEDEGK